MTKPEIIDVAAKSVDVTPRHIGEISSAKRPYLQRINPFRWVVLTLVFGLGGTTGVALVDAFRLWLKTDQSFFWCLGFTVGDHGFFALVFCLSAVFFAAPLTFSPDKR